VVWEDLDGSLEYAHRPHPGEPGQMVQELVYDGMGPVGDGDGNGNPGVADGPH